MAKPKRLQKAEKIIQKYVTASCVAGAIPAPLADVAVITGLQMKMIADLAEIYKIPFKAHVGRSAITSLLATIGTATLARGVLTSVAKIIPGIGTALGAITMPVVSGATTYAIGQVFKKHFADGGTLVDFEAEHMKAQMSEFYKEGEKIIRDMYDAIRDAGEEGFSAVKDAYNTAKKAGTKPGCTKGCACKDDDN